MLLDGIDFSQNWVIWLILVHKGWHGESKHKEPAFHKELAPGICINIILDIVMNCEIFIDIATVGLTHTPTHKITLSAIYTSEGCL